MILLFEKRNNIIHATFLDHILNDIVLSIKNNISELSKVFNDIFSFKFTLDNNFIVCDGEIRISNKFFKDGIKNSIELSIALR